MGYSLIKNKWLENIYEEKIGQLKVKTNLRSIEQPISKNTYNTTCFILMCQIHMYTLE